MTSTAAAKKGFGDVVKEYWGYTRNGIAHFFKKENQMWLSFLLSALILLTSYFIFGVFPVGKQSVLSLDLNGQYVYYYDHMYDVLYGDESIFYSWSRNLSGEWMGIIGYYLGSPFNLIVWLFPRANILDGLLTMMCTKVGAIGLCMSVYLSRSRKCTKLSTVIFSICYALCSYTIVQTMNPMWLDGVMILPIICLGIERFVDQRRFRLLMFAWVYGFVTCFYIGFMLAIFSIIYFMLYMLITKNSEARENFFKVAFSVLGLGIVAVMISAFMLIPVYESLSYGKLSFSTPDYSLKENFPFIELLDKILPNSYDTVRMSGLPFIYCGTITVLLLPSYFFCHKIRRSERIGYAAVLMILVLSMYIRPVDMMWHGGQMPNWLPYRYSFMISFIMTVLAATIFDRIKELNTKVIAVTALVWFGIMVYQENADNFVADLNNGRDTLNNFATILPAMIILFTITAVVLQLRRSLNLELRRNRPRIFSIILIGVICSEAVYNTSTQIYTQHRDIVYSNRASYLDVILPLRDKVDEIKEEDDGFYRIEKLFFRTVNDPLAANMYGLSHSSSTLNAKPINLLKRLGFTAKSHYTRYSGATIITSSLFGVKYELSTPNNTTTDLRNGKEITVEKNEYALPISYLGEKETAELHLTEHDPFAAQTELLNTLIGKDYEYYSRITDLDFNSTNVSAGNTSDEHHSYKKVNANNSATLTYDFTMPKDGKLYMYLPSTYEREIEVRVNSNYIGKYFEGDNNYMRMLGEFKKDEKINVTFTLMKENLYFREAEFAIGDDEMMHRGLTELLELNKDTACELESATKVVSKVSCDRDMTFFTTIPVEKGWKVYVDGVKTDYTETVDSLICVPLTAGEHTVVMKFTTAGYPAAVLISIAGIIIFAGLVILWLKRNPEDRKRRREHLRTIYSGEAVGEIKALKEADIAERKLYREGKITDKYYDEDEFAELDDENKNEDDEDSDAKDNDGKNDKNGEKMRDRKKEKKDRKEDKQDNEVSETSGEITEEQEAKNADNAENTEKENKDGSEKNAVPPKEKKKG